MAAPPVPTARCGFHHCPTDQCPPVDPDLADLLDELRALHVDMRLVPPPLLTVICEDCTAHAAPAVVWLAHRTPSMPHHQGYVTRSALCSSHLYQAVAWQSRRDQQVWVEIHHDFRGGVS